MKTAPLKVHLGAFFASLWIKSLRIRLAVPPNFEPGILGIWHRDLLASCAAFRNWGVHALISQSSDGDFFAMTAQRLGYIVTRGSDTHGATNVRHLLKPLKENQFAGMALDGPHGPADKVKPGSIWLSKMSERPLWLIRARYGAHIKLMTWDNFILPLPLSTIDIQINYLYDEKNPAKVI